MGDLPPPSFSVSNAFRSSDFRTSARKKSALTCWPTTDLQKRPDGTASCWPSSLRNCKSLARRWLRALPAKFSGEQRPELQDPSPHRFVRDIKPTLGEQIFDVAIAEREPHIKP